MTSRTAKNCSHSRPMKFAASFPGVPMHIKTSASTLLKPALLICLALGASLAGADDDNSQRSSVNASFGRGLNTALPPGNPLNHVVLPKRIGVKVGGVVDFGVAGFHDIVIFKPGVTLDDLLDGTGQLPVFPPV